MLAASVAQAADWPKHIFLEIPLEISHSMRFLSSRNFRGKKVFCRNSYGVECRNFPESYTFRYVPAPRLHRRTFVRTGPPISQETTWLVEKAAAVMETGAIRAQLQAARVARWQTLSARRRRRKSMQVDSSKERSAKRKMQRCDG